MKTNKKIKFVSALVTLGTLVPLAAIATSCANQAQNNNTKTNEAPVALNGPVNALYVTVTFNGNEGTLEGQTIVKVRTGKLFGQIAHPKATREGYDFVGWFTAATEGTEVKDDTSISSDCTIYAHWELSAKILTFSTTEEQQTEGVQLYGDTTVEISKEAGVTLATLNKPRAVWANRDFKCWEYDGQEITDESQYTYASFSSNPVLHPVFYEPKVLSMEIFANDEYCPNNILPMQFQSDLDVRVYGQPGVTIDQDDVEWSSDEVSISVDPVTGVISWIPGETGPTTITAKYTNEDETEVTTDIIITPQTPDMVFPNKTYIATPNASVTGVNDYWYANMDELCDSTKDISLTYATNVTSPTPPTHEPIEREDFDEAVLVGTEDGFVPDSFLEGCPNFGDANGVVLFNQDEDFNYNITSIGSGFMAECPKFNDADFALPEGLTYIGSDFMYGCTAFGQDLELANTLKFVGDSFMTKCDNFTHLTVNCDPMYIMSYYTVDTLACTNANAPVVTGGGITVDGNFDDEFRTKFPRLHPDEVGGILYRLYK